MSLRSFLFNLCESLSFSHLFLFLFIDYLIQCFHHFTSPFPPSSLLFPIIPPDTRPCPPQSPFVIGSPPPLSLSPGLPAARSPPRSMPSPTSGFLSLWAEPAAAPQPPPLHPSPLCQALPTAWANICPLPCQPVLCLPSAAAPTASPPWPLLPRLLYPRPIHPGPARPPRSSPSLHLKARTSFFLHHLPASPAA